jgi:aminopeptidase YwaD
MKHLLFLLVFFTSITHAQKIKKSEKIIIANLQNHITFLASDKLEGRRAGTAGEKLAYDYISTEFLNAGLVAKGDSGTFIQSFEVNEGKMVTSAAHFIINDNELVLEKEYFPFVFSPNKFIEAICATALQESGSPWFFDIASLINANKNNPHFDLTDGIIEKVNSVAKKGATALLIYNTNTSADDLKFETKLTKNLTAIPVVYLTKAATKKYITSETATLDIKLRTDIGDKKRWGHNVVGFINNNANNTIIIGAHYDHLGYGEDNNSLYTGTPPMIHNGADDNASGTSALIELSKLLKASKFKKNNYLFIAFSGEELGLYGSKYFTEHPSINLSAANYMINMDMVGRLSDSTHGLNIGGYGTSPDWANVIKDKDKYFAIKFDSSGTGPSDHTSFYRKDIPVLFFFTGTHKDYHKPSDDADKINLVGELQVIKFIFKIIEEADKKNKLVFTKTREVAMGGKSSFKVSLGIMPDYTFSGTGVRVDGVIDGKTAQKVGIKQGDVVTQLGDIKFTDVQSYMGALSKFNKGDAAKVKIKRGAEELVFDIIF